MTVERPFARDCEDLASLSVDDALEACEARGLLPVGWGDDPRRAWSDPARTWEAVREPADAPTFTLLVQHFSGRVTAREYDNAVVRARVEAGTLSTRPESVPGLLADEVAASTPATRPMTTRALLAVVALGRSVGDIRRRCVVCDGRAVVTRPVDMDGLRLSFGGYVSRVRPFPTEQAECPSCDGRGAWMVPRGWDNAETLAHTCVAALRSWGHRGAVERVLWWTTDSLAACVLPAWESADGHFVLHPNGTFQYGMPKLERIAGVYRFSRDHLERRPFPAASELIEMGLRLGRIDATGVTVVAPVQ